MQSIRLTQAQYNYLLPALRSKLWRRCHRVNDEFYFNGDKADVADMWRRLEGLSW